jgi:hypothetical protein
VTWSGGGVGVAPALILGRQRSRDRQGEREDAHRPGSVEGTSVSIERRFSPPPPSFERASLYPPNTPTIPPRSSHINLTLSPLPLFHPGLLLLGGDEEDFDEEEEKRPGEPCGGEYGGAGVPGVAGVGKEGEEKSNNDGVCCFSLSHSFSSSSSSPSARRDTLAYPSRLVN